MRQKIPRFAYRWWTRDAYIKYTREGRGEGLGYGKKGPPFYWCIK